VAADLENPVVTEGGVLMADEARPGVGICEIVPASGDDRARRASDLPSEALLQHEARLAHTEPSRDGLADCVGARDEWGGVTTRIERSHRAVAVDRAADLHLERRAKSVREIEAYEGIGDAQLLDRVVDRHRVGQAASGEDHGACELGVAVREVQLNPGLRHHGGILKAPKIFGSEGRAVKHRASLTGCRVLSAVQAQARWNQQVAVEVEDVLSRHGSHAEGNRRRGASRAWFAGGHPEAGKLAVELLAARGLLLGERWARQAERSQDEHAFQAEDHGSLPRR
jgi:hypothetical protein